MWPVRKLQRGERMMLLLATKKKLKKPPPPWEAFSSSWEILVLAREYLASSRLPPPTWELPTSSSLARLFHLREDVPTNVNVVNLV